MNQIIKDVLEERAAQATPPHVDAAALIRAGHRRTRVRRGIGTVAVAGLAALGVVVASNLVEQSGSSDGTGPIANPQPGVSGAWADADYIYYGTQYRPRPAHLNDITNVEGGVNYSTWDVSAPRAEFFIWLPNEPAGRDLYHARGVNVVRPPMMEGNVTAWFRAGDEDALWLESDIAGPDGPLMVEPSGGDYPTLMDLDPGSAEAPPSVMYLHRGEVWIWDGTGGPQRLSDIDIRHYVDRSHGVTAVAEVAGDQPTTVTFLGPQDNEIGRAQGVFGMGTLDDSASWYLSRSETGPVVVEVATGRQVPIDVGDAMAVQMAWNPDGDVTVVTQPQGEPGAPVDLLTCSSVDGQCALVAEDVGASSDIMLADGIYAGP
jgi:hypothetical protein